MTERSNPPRVTIGIPTYNRAGDYLPGAIESALSQGYPALEVLISDNGSRDHTAEVVRSFSDDRLRYVVQEENLGPIGNMNYLVEEANGDYLLVLHDDDRIDPDFVESCMQAAGYRTDPALVVTGSRVIDGEGRAVRDKENAAAGMNDEEFIVFWYRKGVHLFLCNCLFNTSILRSVGGFREDLDLFTDVAAEFLCASEGTRVDVREVKASFREHGGSQTSHSALARWCRSGLALLDLATELAPTKRDELRTIGTQTSADRNYRYALEAESPWARARGCWTVFRHYRRMPRAGFWRSILGSGT